MMEVHTPVASRRGAGVCPACERFIGTADTCPYCDTDSARAPFFRRLRPAALALSLCGVGLLWLVAARTEVPSVAVADITPTMNFATVRVIGTVAGKPYVRWKDGRATTFAFTVAGRTGTIRVAAYDEIAHALATRKPPLREGRHADIVGRVAVSAGSRTSLRVQAARHVKVFE